MLIDHRAVGLQTFVGGFCQVHDNGSELCLHVVLTEYEGGFPQQPGSFDVVTVALYVAAAVPLVVEEQVEMMGLLII